MAVLGGPAEADVVVPVPLHHRPERERGYNQAALIAKPLAKRLGLPYKSVLLTRIRPRPEKHLFTIDERLGVRSWRFCHTSGQPS
jgi:predicted amidophosphoribosyltransferase